VESAKYFHNQLPSLRFEEGVEKPIFKRLRRLYRYSLSFALC
jgi:hypothetical protein